MKALTINCASSTLKFRAVGDFPHSLVPEATVRVVRTDEDMIIASHTCRLMGLTEKEGA